VQVKHWSNTGQTLVKPWSNPGQTLVKQALKRGLLSDPGVAAAAAAAGLATPKAAAAAVLPFAQASLTGI
jgi:hypothetical protein